MAQLLTPTKQILNTNQFYFIQPYNYNSEKKSSRIHLQNCISILNSYRYIFSQLLQSTIGCTNFLFLLSLHFWYNKYRNEELIILVIITVSVGLQVLIRQITKEFLDTAKQSIYSGQNCIDCQHYLLQIIIELAENRLGERNRKEQHHISCLPYESLTVFFYCKKYFMTMIRNGVSIG